MKNHEILRVCVKCPTAILVLPAKCLCNLRKQSTRSRGISLVSINIIITLQCSFYAGTTHHLRRTEVDGSLAQFFTTISTRSGLWHWPKDFSNVRTKFIECLTSMKWTDVLLEVKLSSKCLGSVKHTEFSEQMSC